MEVQGCGRFGWGRRFGVCGGKPTWILRLQLGMTGRGGEWRWVGQVGGGDLEDVGEEACSLEIHAVGGEQGGKVSEGELDGVAGEGGGDLEGLVFVDGWDDFVAVGEAHVVVVHGAGAAAATVVVVVHALVRDGGLAAEVVVGVREAWCVAPPGVGNYCFRWCGWD